LHLHSIPFPFNTFQLKSDYKRYPNNSENNLNLFVNVTNLELDSQILAQQQREDYFANVTSLVLNGDSATVIFVVC